MHLFNLKMFCVDNLMYLSPCLAGCDSFSSTDNYTDCACVENGAGGGGTVSRTKCDNECGYLIPMCVLLVRWTLKKLNYTIKIKKHTEDVQQT